MIRRLSLERAHLGHQVRKIQSPLISMGTFQKQNPNRQSIAFPKACFASLDMDG